MQKPGRPFIDVVVERLADPASPSYPAFVAVAEIIRGALLAVRRASEAVTRHAEAFPASPGYEPLLIERGVHPLLARLFGNLITANGRRWLSESEFDRPIAMTIKRLAQPGIRVATVSRLAAELLAFPEGEVGFFIRSLDRIGRSQALRCSSAACQRFDPAACCELSEIAGSVADQVKPRRGRPLTLQSATHQTALAIMSVTQASSYTFNPVTERYDDPVTLATMAEFGLKTFDPRPAYRRLKESEESEVNQH